MSYLSPQTGPKRTLDRVTNGSLWVSRAAGLIEMAREWERLADEQDRATDLRKKE
jgi:hypothetical protein